MNPQDITVVFIAGHEHSGSTILDLHLQCHQAVVSVGEAISLASYVSKDERSQLCTCGSVFSECRLWRRVADEAARLGRPLCEMEFGVGSTEFGPSSEIFFQAVAKVTGRTIIIDSSKGIRRLLRLQRETRLRILPVYISRSLYGFVGSYRKRMNIGRREAMRLALRYISHCTESRNALRNVPHLRVRLEDLIADTDSVIRSVYRFAGVKPAEMQFGVMERPELPHNLAGNRLLREGPEPLAQARASPVGPLFNAPSDAALRVLSGIVDVYPRLRTNVG